MPNCLKEMIRNEMLCQKFYLEITSHAAANVKTQILLGAAQPGLKIYLSQIMRLSSNDDSHFSTSAEYDVRVDIEVDQGKE